MARQANRAVLASIAAVAAALTAASTAQADVRPAAGGTAPGIDPAYVYAQLDRLVTFQHREAGYVAGSAGHSGFASYWQRQMLRLLGQYGARAREYQFPVRGWAGRPATAPAADVEVTVPGLVQPAREVVIGCHYDGEASSTQSANDDASGCAVELGVARAMASYWTRNHLYPARTLRFVLFDAEEQGIFGSFYYVSEVMRNDLPEVSAMINEEQSGIAYPLRYLGLAANPVLPFYAYVSPLASNTVYPGYEPSPAQRDAAARFRVLVRQAAAAAFRQYRQSGDQMLTYHGQGGTAVWRPVFTPSQLRYVRVLSDTLGGSDQIAFTDAGVRCATFAGSTSYYTRNPPPGSYPFDQPQDTLALMNTFADGGATRSHALELALGLPGLLTTSLLGRVLGAARSDGRPAAAISDTGVVLPGRPVTFDAAASYDPARPGAHPSYRWDFGDGQSGAGRTVSHVYSARGSYSLRLTVTSASGRSRVITKPITVGPRPGYHNPYAALAHAPLGSFAYSAARGRPLANPTAILPAASEGRHDQVATAAQARRLSRRGGSRHSGSAPGWVPAGLGGGLVALCAVWLAGTRRRRAPSR